MKITRRGFIGSMLAALTAGVVGFLGLAQAGISPSDNELFDTKAAKFKVIFSHTPLYRFEAHDYWGFN